MIQLHINPARVERVLFVPASDLEEDFDLAAWRLIRPLVDRIDRKLRWAAAKAAAAARCTRCRRVLLDCDRAAGVCDDRRACAFFARRAGRRESARAAEIARGEAPSAGETP